RIDRRGMSFAREGRVAAAKVSRRDGDRAGRANRGRSARSRWRFGLPGHAREWFESALKATLFRSCRPEVVEYTSFLPAPTSVVVGLVGRGARVPGGYGAPRDRSNVLRQRTRTARAGNGRAAAKRACGAILTQSSALAAAFAFV